MTTLNFSKLHATGNDFLVLIDLEARFGSRGRNRLAPALRAALCDRRRGVGRRRADPPARRERRRRLRDGAAPTPTAGLAEISGNGLRCLAHVAAKLGLGAGDRLVVDTAAGRREMTIRRRAEDGEVDYAEADMGLVMFTPEMIPRHCADDPFDLEATVDGVAYRGGAAASATPISSCSSTTPAPCPSTATARSWRRDHATPTARTWRWPLPTALRAAGCGSGNGASARPPPAGREPAPRPASPTGGGWPRPG